MEEVRLELGDGVDGEDGEGFYAYRSSESASAGFSWWINLLGVGTSSQAGVMDLRI